MTQLQEFIAQIPVCDTHEHQMREELWIKEKPDILQTLFDNYFASDLRVAGNTGERIHRLVEVDDADIEARFEANRVAWEMSQFTGYGEAVRLAARHFWGIERIDGPSLARAQRSLPARWQPGDQLRILRDKGRMDHVQIDHFDFHCEPNPGGPDFFLHDLSWVNPCSGRIEPAKFFAESGVDVKDLATLRAAMEAVFERNAPLAIAVKAQHAYGRTLAWRERTDAEAAAALEEALRTPFDSLAEERRLCLGDWCWARGVELAIKHNMPFKLHTGYYAGHARMVMERIRPSLLCPLLIRYPAARFVLMHMSYPYEDELIAITKHFPNVYADMCWGWSMNSRAGMDFVRRFITAAPLTKLFGFGGDTNRPHASVGYALHARRWLARALQAEVDDGDMTEARAMTAAQRILHDNQYDCFDLAGRRATIAAAGANAAKRQG